MYLVITIVFAIFGWLVQARLKSKFSQYSQIGLRNGRSGKEVAEAMLRHYGIHDVQVVSVPGFLTDHYNPADKTVNLSPEVYEGRSIAAAAVASHECGHAVQHATAYTALQMRSAIVPVVQIASSMQQYLLLFGLGIMGAQGSQFMLLLTVIAFGITAAFSLITLPVEFDASKRALAWLESSNFTQGSEHEGAKDALKWAALTYVVAALSALTMFLYFVFRLMGSRE